MPKICLDPGHSGANYNTGGWGYYESQRMWDLCNLLVPELKARGFEVITTRSAIDVNVEVYNRGAMSKGCDCFISLHSNACGTESVDYSVVYRAYDNKNNADTFALKLAQEIGKLMGNKQTGKTATRKTDSGTEYYGVMRGARAVNCPLYLLIEHSFHTNETASKWLLSNDNLKKLAILEADLLAEHFGLSGGVATTAPSAQVAPATVTDFTPYTVRKTCQDPLNVRQGPSTDYPINTTIDNFVPYTIVEEQNGWGRLKSGAGWISLAFTKKD